MTYDIPNARIEAQGNLTASPVLRTTNNGKTYATFTVAVNNKWTDKQGVTHEGETLFLDCASFSSNAEALTQLAKGTFVMIKASVSPVRFNRKDGTEVESIRLKVLSLGVIPTQPVQPSAPVAQVVTQPVLENAPSVPVQAQPVSVPVQPTAPVTQVSPQPVVESQPVKVAQPSVSGLNAWQGFGEAPPF